MTRLDDVAVCSICGGSGKMIAGEGPRNRYKNKNCPFCAEKIPDNRNSHKIYTARQVAEHIVNQWLDYLGCQTNQSFTNNELENLRLLIYNAVARIEGSEP